MRSKFDQQLAALNQELTEMGATCAQAIGLAAQALEQQDVALAAPVGQLEEQTNEQERTIEALCLKLLLQQQPVARDLRQISAALKMITDMERIGDQAADIAEIIPFFLSHNTFDCTLVCRMAQQASSMVTQSVDVKAMTANLVTVTESMNRTMVNVEHMMANMNSVLGDPQTAENVRATLANLKDTSERVQHIAENLEGVAGDPQTAEDLRQTVKNARSIIEKALK